MNGFVHFDLLLSINWLLCCQFWKSGKYSIKAENFYISLLNTRIYIDNSLPGFHTYFLNFEFLIFGFQCVPKLYWNWKKVVWRKYQNKESSWTYICHLLLSHGCDKQFIFEFIGYKVTKGVKFEFGSFEESEKVEKSIILQ